MISDLGTILLTTAFLLALLQVGLVCVPTLPLYKKLLPAVSLCGLMVLTTAFVVLLYAFAISDFSLRIVAENSHSLKPMFYKITSAWGNHEGSILLWCWVLTFYSALITLWKDANLPLTVRAYALHVMGGIQTIFLAYTLWTSSPFTAIFPVPPEGAGFNPLLQDVGLAFHPPLLYLGYVGCAAPFALSVAALVSGHVREHSAQAFARALHPWILFPWTCLTAGIGLGSWWAYRELGWGGWWFWDPVENASLLPWLIATALFHANLVMRKRGNFARSVMALSLLAFILSMLGTFLVRSGIITSVHSFASDPTRGYAVLAMLATIAGYGIYAYLRYGEALKPTQPLALLSREAAVLVNNLLLVLSMAGIVLAMLYPLIVEAITGRMLTIGSGYYNGVFTALMLPMLAVCALSTATVWGGGSIPPRRARAVWIWGAVASALAWVFTWRMETSWLCFLGLAAGGWVLLVTLHAAWKKRGVNAMVLGHGGLAVFTLAATLYGALHHQSEFVMRVGESKQAGDVTMSLNAMTHGVGANYVNRIATLQLKARSGIATLFPEERYYPVEEQFTSEAAIITSLTHDDYATIKRVMQVVDASEGAPESVTVQLHHNPAMLWVWGGVALMVSAGATALMTGRKHTRLK
jgi:cytochrome c-type biogenesis protein CcmF